jgi:cyclic beta-1,2-glucan synthetase
VGAAGLFYFAGMEWILSLQVRADLLVFNPCIPKVWRSYSIFCQHENTRYEITVDNPNGVEHVIVTIELDGERQLNDNSITLQDDGQLHQVRVVLG